MNHQRKLTILWTNSDLVTSEKMVLMYARNALMNQWWDEITVVIWGATSNLVVENKMIQEKIKMAAHVGVHFSACIACADQLGVSGQLADLGIELKPWGLGITEAIQGEDSFITI